MSEAYYQTPIEAVRRWHGLSERRRNHVVELYRSERWRRYYTEDSFRSLMRDAIQDAETWARVFEDMGGQLGGGAAARSAGTKVVQRVA
jgi:uncharacterized repeat protein (TIGR03809 family)